MADPAAPPRPPRRRWMAVALFVSVALNLMVLGVVLGMLGRGGPPPERIARIDPGSALHVGALDERDRRALRADWAARVGDPRQLRADRRAETAALAAALRQEPYDPARVAALMAAAQERAAARQAAVLALVAERLAAMSPAERAAYADRLEAAARRGPARPGDPRNGARPTGDSPPEARRWRAD